MENNFTSLGVNDSILKAISELGFETPTNVQQEAIPAILDKKDLIVMSKTGSGKTGAFGIPILQQLDPEIKEPQALILAPTRELAVQVESDIKKMGKYLEVKTIAVYGQHSIETEIKGLAKGPALVSGTPGRVLDHIKRGTLKTKGIKFLVLDEADRMLDMGFIDEVSTIITKTPDNRMTMLFSATMPIEVRNICQAYMREPVTIELETETKTVDTVEQLYYRVEKNEKRTQLNKLLKYEQPESCMIFCNTRFEVDRVQGYLERKGYQADALHGANNQNQRMKTIQDFKKGKVHILVATDVAARGLHIDDMELVINYDVPDDKNSYVHRIGRTGRAGQEGKAISLVTSDSIMSLYEIEEHVGVLIEEAELPSDEAIREKADAASGKWEKIIESQNRHQSSHRAKQQHPRPAKHHQKSATGSDLLAQQAKPAKPAKPGKPASSADEAMKTSAKRSVPVAQKKHVKVIMTKMGPVEVVSYGEEKKSLLSKVFGWLKK